MLALGVLIAGIGYPVHFVHANVAYPSTKPILTGVLDIKYVPMDQDSLHNQLGSCIVCGIAPRFRPPESNERPFLRSKAKCRRVTFDDVANVARLPDLWFERDHSDCRLPTDCAPSIKAGGNVEGWRSALVVDPNGAVDRRWVSVARRCECNTAYRDNQLRAELNLSVFASDLYGFIGGSDGLIRGFKRPPENPDRINAHACCSKGEYRHQPLSDGIIPRVETIYAGYRYSDLIWGAAIAAAATLVGYLLMGFILLIDGKRDKKKKEQAKRKDR